MKPGDHPDFFRLPPPPGASRESTIAIDREGHFTHDGQPIDKPALEKALRSWVAAHPDNGRPILTNGYDWTYFKVEDAPLIVEAVHVDDRGHATMKLFDDTEEALDPSTLSVGDDGVVYARARDGRLDARFSRHAQTDLASILVAGEPPVVRLDGRDHALPRRAK